MKNFKNAGILHNFCPKNYQDTQIFMIFDRKINKIPELYMIFARKMPEFYTIISQKNIFPEFLWAPTPMLNTLSLCPPHLLRLC